MELYAYLIIKEILLRFLSGIFTGINFLHQFVFLKAFELINNS